MKIRSWTGNEVEARCGMRGNKLSVAGEWEIVGIVDPAPPSNLECWPVIRYNELHLKRERIGFPTVFCLSKPELFTMLHAPFMIGDEIEELMNRAQGRWEVNKTKTMKAKTLPFINSLKPGLYFRHVNPDYRTSPEYKHE